MNTNKLLIGLTVLVVLLGLGVAYLAKRSHDSQEDFKSFQVAMSNQFKTFTDKQGHEIAQVNAAVFANSGDFKAVVKQLNANGANIQSKIDNNTQGLILLSKRVGGMISGNTTIAKQDTVKVGDLKANNGKDSTGYKIYPVYAINDSNKFYSINGQVGYKGYQLRPVFFDSTELTPQNISGGFFKPSVLGIQSLNKNPYAHTTGLKYLVVKKTPAPFWRVLEDVGVFVGGVLLGKHL